MIADWNITTNGGIEILHRNTQNTQTFSRDTVYDQKSMCTYLYLVVESQMLSHQSKNIGT